MIAILSFFFSMVNHPGQVVGGPVVVGTQLPVGFTAAGSVIPGQGVPAAVIHCQGHGLYIGSGGVAFQAVGDDDQPVATGRGPVQVQKVVVWGLDAFPCIIKGGNFPE